MGGGDLNMKKSWHPGLIKNRAQVWEDQHAALQERKRIEALKKEIEEERAANELQKLNEANGGAKRQERVDFLYAGPGAGSGLVEDREAYLLGHKRIDDVLGKDNVGETVGQGKSIIPSSNGGLNMRDLTNKISLDPLLAIKKQEAAQYEAMVNRKKAELEAEARKNARREARSGHDRSRRYSSRDVDEHGRQSDRRDNEYRDRRSHRSSRRDRSNSLNGRQRDHRRHRDGHRSDSRRHRSDSSSPSRKRRHSRSPLPRDNSARSTRKHNDRGVDGAPATESRSRTRHSRSKSPNGLNTNRETSHRARTEPKDEAAIRAAKLAEMTASATELDDIRNRRVQESRMRDEAERAMENVGRRREAESGGNSGFVRQMQLSAGLVR